MYGTVIDLESHASLLTKISGKTFLDRQLKAVTESLMCQKIIVAVPNAIRFSLSGANTKHTGINILQPGLPSGEVFYYGPISTSQMMHQAMRMNGLSVAIRLTMEHPVVQGFLLDEALQGKQLDEYTNYLGRLTFVEACQRIDAPAVISVAAGPAMDIDKYAELLWGELDKGASWSDVMTDLARYRSQGGQEKLPE